LEQGSRTLESAVRAAVGDRVAVAAGPRPQDLTLTLGRAGDVVEVAGALDAVGLSLATLVGTDERALPDGDFKVRYVFEPASGVAPLPDAFVTVVASVDRARPELPSITARTPAANWHEREVAELFGVVFVDHPEPRPLVLHDGWPRGHHPLRKDWDAAQRPPMEPAEEFPHLVVEGEGVLEIPVGPIHAGIIEPGHFRFSTAGEAVLRLEPRLFYTHRGLEKRIEGRGVLEAAGIVERICGVCSVAHALGYAEAVERLAGVEIPARARALRTVALELERLYNHVGDLGNISAGASYHYGTSAGLRMKEALQQVNEELTGSRFLRGWVLPGGVRFDVTPPLARALGAAVDATEEALASLVDRMENNPSFLDRCVTTGVLTYEQAVALAVTGVGARASGVDRDARRDHPHAAYEREGDLAVRVATERAGDVQARLLVRVAEARESMRLLRALLGALPPGPLAAPWPAALPPWGVGLSAIESPRGAAVHWVRVDDRGRIDRYHLRSPSYANWPAVALAAETAIVPDFPIVNKSFELCYSCTDR